MIEILFLQKFKVLLVCLNAEFNILSVSMELFLGRG